MEAAVPFAAMPELPEMEAWRRQLDEPVAAFPVARAGPAHIATLKTFEPPLSALDGGDRVARAMRVRPDLVGGPDGTDYLLMQAAPGWLAKGGAEGLLCAAGPDGVGVALKTEDGASRAHAPALASFLQPLEVDLPDLATRPVVSTRGERVGDLVTTGCGSV